MIHRTVFAVGFLALALSFTACSKSSPNPIDEGGPKSAVQPDRLQDRELVLQRLGPLTSLLQSMELFPKSYAVTVMQTTEKTKEKIFEAWLQEKLKVVDKRMHDEILEWLEYKTYLRAKQSRQEEVGILRREIAIRDMADNFYFAAPLSEQQIAELRDRLTELMASGIEFGYNGFDLKGCGETEDNRQTDDYVISPLFIEPATGRVFEFKYKGGCWD